MRLSEWRAKAPVRDGLGPKITAVVAPILAMLDVEDDPHAWVLWGDDPASRFSIYAPTPAGLVTVAVRANPGGAGARASAKLIRWSRLQVGELVVETEGAHRMISFQIESAVLRGADDVADAIGRFALILLSAIEGRPWPSFDPPARRRASGKAVTGKSAAGKTAAGKPAGRGTAGPAARGDRAAGASPTRKLPALPARTATTGPAGRGRGTAG